MQAASSTTGAPWINPVNSEFSVDPPAPPPADQGAPTHHGAPVASAAQPPDSSGQPLALKPQVEWVETRLPAGTPAEQASPADGGPTLLHSLVMAPGIASQANVQDSSRLLRDLPRPPQWTPGVPEFHGARPMPKRPALTDTVLHTQPLRVDDSMSVMTQPVDDQGAALPLTPVAKAAAEAAAPTAPAAPTADPMEIAALELLLADPANREMVEHFGGELQPLPTWTSVGQGIEARYGADLGGRLYQLQQAQREVEGQFFQAMDRAQQSPPSAVPYMRRGDPVPDSGQPGWLYHGGSGHWDGDPPSWQFDPGAFARHYVQGDSPVQRAFAQLRGSDPVQFVPAPNSETAESDKWTLSGLTLRQGRAAEHDEGQMHTSWVSSGVQRPEFHLDPDRITKLNNKELLWFDPVHGFATDPDNIKGDWLDRAMPYIFAGAVTAMTFGAGSTVAAGIASAAGGGTAGTIAVGASMGAVSNAALQLAANGKINFGQLLQSALAGGATAGISQIPGVGQYLDGRAGTFGQRLMEYTGRATVQGAIQSVLGGNFRDGMVNSLLGSVAGEVTAQLDAQISSMQGLNPSEASALRLLTRATGSAMRIAGSGDPAAGFASDFLNSVMQEGLAAHQPQSDPLGVFIAANEARRELRDQVLDVLEQALSGDGTDRGDLVAAVSGTDGFRMPQGVVDSATFLGGFLEGVGIRGWENFDGFVGLVRNPGQVVEAIDLLIHSPQARSQLAESALARISRDSMEFQAAMDRGDMQVAGQQFGILTAQLLEAVGGVAGLTALAGASGRGVERLVDAIRRGELHGPAAGGRGAQLGGVNIAPTTRLVAEYGPLAERGPLPLEIANTFRSGAYAETVTTQPTVLYRVYGGTASQLGAYWTTMPPAGPVQSIIDSALDPAWGNSATRVVRIEVPAGVRIFQGQAASQGGLVGGGNQVLFPIGVRVDPSWIKK